MLVKATNMSRKLNVQIKELGRVAFEGEEFEVTPSRYNTLKGENRYRAVFVQEVKQIEDVYERTDTIPFEVQEDVFEEQPKEVVEEPEVNEEVEFTEQAMLMHEEEPEVVNEPEPEEVITPVEDVRSVEEEQPKPKKKRRSSKKKTKEVVE